MMLSKFESPEDWVVAGKVLAALGEMEILPADPLPVVFEYGPHRLYQWAIITRDDVPFQTEVFCMLLDSLNAVGRIRPYLYEAESYPAEIKNFTRYYVTVFI